MYTNEDYIAEKNLMTKQERMIQERFEHLINILILYINIFIPIVFIKVLNIINI